MAAENLQLKIQLSHSNAKIYDLGVKLSRTETMLADAKQELSRYKLACGKSMKIVPAITQQVPRWPNILIISSIQLLILIHSEYIYRLFSYLKSILLGF